jgi:penicillin amidase
MVQGPSRRRRGRRVLLAGLALASLLVGVFAAVQALNRGRAMREAFPPVEGSLTVKGLGSVATVTRDPRGIPHVDAASEADAYRVLGLVHAHDRLAQMEWLRRSAEGRLAEVLGPPALDADWEARVVGIAHHAKRAFDLLPQRTRALLSAYAGGINAQVERLQADEAALPLALRRLEIQPDLWSEADSVALVKLYAWTLAGHPEAGMVLQELIELLGGFGARPFFPPGVGSGGLADPPGMASTPAVSAPGEDPRAAPWKGALARFSGLSGRGIGSSAFVIGGHHTQSGRPILAADAHLPARAPSLLYQAHLRWPEGQVAGVTIPGIPLFWIGHNGRVAWSAIHAGAVVADLYVESLHPDGGRYHDGRRWRELRERVEEIRVLGGDSESITVQETVHGPLLTTPTGSQEPLALAWPGARRGDSLSALWAVTRARDSAGLRAALELHHEPTVAVVYADDAGAAGLQMAGWVPQRSLPTGLVPVPGRNRWYSWGERVPYGLLPHVELDGDQGFAVAADARLQPDEHVVIEWLWRTGGRSHRLAQLLRRAAESGSLDVGAAAEVQRDVSSPGAPAVVEEALRLAGPAEELGKEERWVAEVLQSWDGRSSSDSVGATVYHVFLNRLLDTLLEPWVGRDLEERYLAIPHVDPVYLVRRLLTSGPVAGDPGVPAGVRIPEAVRQSLRSTWIWLSVELGPNRDRWGWGRVHRLTFEPLWDTPGWERRWLGPFPAPGDGATVWVAEYDLARPFDVRVASTFRFAVDLARPQEALTSLAPGQSGHPGHPQSVDGVARWLDGRPRLLATSPILVEETAVARMVLEPAP